MVKTPRTRHSKPQRAPVTIDLTATESRAVEPAEVAAEPVVVMPAGPPETATGRPQYIDESASETAFDQPVEDRLEDEAALTGKAHAYSAKEPASPPPPTGQTGRGGWATHIAAGVIGGVLAAGV